MTDYKAYREAVGIENPDMTRTLQGMFPRYSKVDANFVNNPKQHGLCLLPEAEQLLVHVYGPGPGLQHTAKKKPEKRKKSHAITFRMTDELYGMALQLQESAGGITMQDLFEIILRNAYREWEVTA